MDPLRRELRDTADGLVRALQRVGIELSFDREGVEQVEAYVERNRALWSADDRERMCVPIGCFVGECMAAVYAAGWSREGDGEPGIRLSTGDTAFPITKAYKFLGADGAGGADGDDGLLSFFDATGAIIARGGITRG